MGLCTSKDVPNSNYNKQPKKSKLTYASTVLTNNEERYVFETQIQPLIIKCYSKNSFDFKISFRASQHAYLAEHFHNLTNGLTDTILLVKTVEGKIFGAFTTCAWQKDVSYKYQSDENMQSFLFSFMKQQREQINDDAEGKLQLKKKKSIKCRHKIYKLIQKQKAIMNHHSKGPIFGEGHDIFIEDQCNKNDSWCNLGKSYSCPYPFGSKKANSQLGGAAKFLVHDYEVWSITV